VPRPLQQLLSSSVPPLTTPALPGEEEDRRTEFQLQQHQRAQVSQQVRHELKTEGLRSAQAYPLLQQLRTTCLLCLYTSRRVHLLQECPGNAQQGSYDEAVRYLQVKIRYDRFSGCYKCGLPQEICDWWESVPRGYQVVRERACQFPEVLIRGMAVFLLPGGSSDVFVQEDRDSILERISKREDDRTKEAITRFLGRKRRTA